LLDLLCPAARGGGSAKSVLDRLSPTNVAMAIGCGLRAFGTGGLGFAADGFRPIAALLPL
jgi:hypothetical protein